jgi:adenylate cyclase
MNSDRSMEPSQGLNSGDSVQLRIIGRDPSHRLQQPLHEGQVLRLGRIDHAGQLVIPWDLAISREHADLCWKNGRLRVTCLPSARHPIIYQHETTREVFVSLDESFMLGSTRFQVVSVRSQAVSILDTEEYQTSDIQPPGQGKHTYTPNDLQQVAFHNAEQQLEFLSQLPGRISASQSDIELGQTVCSLLLDAIPHAAAVAVAHYDLATLPGVQDSQTEFPQPVTIRVQTRNNFRSTFRPSRSIITKSLREQKSVLYVWAREALVWAREALTAEFTISEGLDWALCTPIRGESCEGWCMYVSGKGSRKGGLYVSEKELLADVRFTELVAQFIGSMRHVQSLQEQKTKLNSFFSPKVIDSLKTGMGADVLAPAERNITVLFCDVRGFSRKAERLQDNLFSLLDSVRAALSVMVDGILDRDGAIADFQGDAAMGFWGWPVALEYGPIPACRAAIAIQHEFRKQSTEPGSLLEGFSVGIGIAHGRAIAGQIGTRQQSKIGVFGPVVNQCARLESMTKQFGVSICIDSATAEFVDRYFSTTDGRLRPLAKVRPQGMENPIDVYNLLPPESDFPEVSEEMIIAQESVFKDVVNGHWTAAIATLEKLPDADGPKQCLLRQMAKSDYSPPVDWDGTFALEGK